MSFGDEIIASGHAKVEHERTGKRVVIMDRQGKPRWSPLWDGNPAVSRTIDDSVMIQNGPGCRPYIKYPFTLDSGCRYSGWRASDHRGRIYLTTDEMSWAQSVVDGRIVVIEPNLAARSNPNKQWHGYQAVVNAVPNIPWVQIGPPGTPLLDGVRHIVTSSFRDGCAVLSMASAYIGPEGGLHHACAALGVPAVVIFGGSPSVDATGYPEHRNLADPEPCGQWRPCPHCATAMQRITPEMVIESLRTLP